MDAEKITLTPDEAESLLPEGDTVHNYLNPGAGLMMGCDFSRESAVEALSKAVQIEIGGDGCKGMGHALVVWDTEKSYSFFEADKGRVAEMEAAKG